jgi:hypothetical protein
MESRSTALFFWELLWERRLDVGAGRFRSGMRKRISPDRDNTITYLYLKPNLMLFSCDACFAVVFHLRGQHVDEMRRIGQARRAPCLTTIDTEHHLMVTHEVANSGSDRAQVAAALLDHSLSKLCAHEADQSRRSCAAPNSNGFRCNRAAHRAN